MNELIGFIVLTGPLFFIVLWVPISIISARWITKRLKVKNSYLKSAFGIFLFLVVLIVPVFDEIISTIIFYQVCSVKSELKVLRSTDIPIELLDNEGNPALLNKYSRINWNQLGRYFEWRRSKEPYIGGIIKIDKWKATLYEKQSGKEIGERLTFARESGWLLRNFSPSPEVDICRNIWFRKYDREVAIKKENEEEQEFISKIFNLSPDSIIQKK
jgi:hypothetical protein